MINQLEASEPSELTPIILDMELTRLGSEASNFESYLYNFLQFLVLQITLICKLAQEMKGIIMLRHQGT